MNMYFPPAVSEFKLLKIISKALSNQEANLDKSLCSFFGSQQAISGNSWVKILVKTLEVVSDTDPSRGKVILPAYCCSEFVKAILQAGLEPKFIDFTAEYTMNVGEVEKALDEDVLAVISINNTGAESDNLKVKKICHDYNVVCFEDATYTYLGNSSLYPQQKFGSFGDFSILNFSEGKTMPIGGGAILLNNSKYIEDFKNLRDKIYEIRPMRNMKELESLFVYKLGASRLGYEIYKRLKRLIGIDFKNRFSMEPIRVANRVDRDLLISECGKIIFEPERKKKVDAIPLRPLNKIKRLCGLDVLENYLEYNKIKKKTYTFYKRHLNSKNYIGKLVEMPSEAMLVKIPFNFKQRPPKHVIDQLNELGMAKQYSMKHPMYQFTEFKNSRHFYQCSFTLPVHCNMTRKAQLKIIKILKNL